MSTFLALTVVGLVIGCIYALTASGLVVTYTTSGVFNFAHGAIGMFAAFSYWQLSVAWGVPAVLSLLIVIGVGAPLFGALVERSLVRGLGRRSPEVPLVATLGLLVVLIGAASAIWPPTEETRRLPSFFDGQLPILSVNVSYDNVMVIAVAALVAIALRVLFTRTRIGIAMRAVVDDPDLAALTGVSPNRVSQTAWALGAGLAALAGILLAPTVTLNIFALTLIIINAFAAAMVGRLRSLPLTALGALLLGLAVSYGTGYLGATSFLARLQPAIPMIFLFVVLVLLPQDRVQGSSGIAGRTPRLPGLRASVVAGVAFVVLCAAVSTQLGPSQLDTVSRSLGVALVLLSLVLLVGWAGQISLCHYTFAGLGAYAMGTWGDGGSLGGLLLAALLPAVVGALVAVPTLRMRGLYLALATLAFAQATDVLFFNRFLGASGSLSVPRLDLPLVPELEETGWLITTSVLFALAAIGLLAVKRGSWGRRLAALNDSPQACATLGLDVRGTKVAVFAASAGLAGIGGAIIGGSQGAVGPNDFLLLQSLLLLLVLLVGGRNTVSGALLGAVLFGVLPVIEEQVPELAGLRFLLIGIAVFTLAKNPNGLVGAGALLRERIGRGRTGTDSGVVVPVQTGPRADDREEERVASLTR